VTACPPLPRPAAALRRAARAGSRAGSRSGSRRHARGYSLIEVIVAFALLALALTLLLGTLSGATRQVRWSGDAGRAALHAQSLLAQVGVGEVLEPGQRDGEFDDGRYRWSLSIQPWRDAGLPASGGEDAAALQLYELSLDVQWGNDRSGQRLPLRTLRAVAPAAAGGGRGA